MEKYDSFNKTLQGNFRLPPNFLNYDSFINVYLRNVQADIPLLIEESTWYKFTTKLTTIQFCIYIIAQQSFDFRMKWNLINTLLFRSFYSFFQHRNKTSLRSVYYCFNRIEHFTMDYTTKYETPAAKTLSSFVWWSSARRQQTWL